jgi:hypothetical protein
MAEQSKHTFHGGLPIDAQNDLMRASQTPITRADPLARVKAIEQATQRIKRKYPELFKEPKQ